MRAPAVLVSGVVLAQPAGGVRRHAQELLPRLAERLAAAGGRLAVLAGADGVPFELPAGVELIESVVPTGPPVRRVLPEGRALARAVEAAAHAGRPFDLVHTAHLPVPRRLALPYTLTRHDLRQLELPGAPFARRLLARSVIGRALRQAAGVFVVSETVRRDVLERFTIDPQRVFVVPNAADHLEVEPRRPGTDAPVLAVGHIEPRKNLGLLLEALAVDPGLPPLVVAGRPKGQEQARLAARARELGLESRVRFTGPFEERELAGLYATAACVAIPSHVEGFGVVALEAQRAGVPLAVSTGGALPEVAGPNVPTFAPDDAAGCARALRAALAQPAATLAEHAERAGRYRWETSAERWFDGLCATFALTESTRR